MPEPIDVVYDRECRFCSRVLHAIGRLDRAHRIRLHASQDRAAVAARFPQLAGADFANAMFVVSSTGVSRGYFAFKEIMRNVPLAWPIRLLFHVPGADLAGPKVYSWVARHRQQFGCDVDRSGRASR